MQGSKESHNIQRSLDHSYTLNTALPFEEPLAQLPDG